MKPIERMIREIEAEVKYTSRYIGKSALDNRVIDAMAKVPRHKFVPPGLEGYAYDNRPLSIGDGQTISQPYIVAIMTDLLDINENSIILEVGTGSGYQAAILAELAAKVYSTEIIESLSKKATECLNKMGYSNIETRVSNGYQGWPEQAPYDGIIVTAAAPHIPPPLLEQLKPGGKMVIPIGGPLMGQDLLLVEKDREGTITEKNILSVVFVPLTGESHFTKH